MEQDAENTKILASLAADVSLAVLGTVTVEPDDLVPAGSRSIALLGPGGPGFWDHFTQSPEYLDGKAHAMDRWSDRTITALAAKISGQPLFPFVDPPLPFVSWALRSGRAWSSPIAMLVHDQAGLFVSFRGAIALPWTMGTPPVATKPCLGCQVPCVTACPVDALSKNRYDIAACHDFLNTEAGQDCMENGCAARRACPISKTSGRLPAQSAFHMKAFHK